MQNQRLLDGKIHISWLVQPNTWPSEVLNPLIQEFESKYSNFKVDIVLDETGTKQNMLVAAERTPDLILAANLTLRQQKPLLFDLTHYVLRDSQEIDLEDFYPQILDTCKLDDGRYLMLPTPSFNSQILVYNVELFDKIGLAYPDDSWTWDSMVEGARLLTIGGPNDPSKVRQWGLTEYFGWWGGWLPFVQQAGGQLFSPEGDRCSLDTPEAVKALRFYYDVVYKYRICPPPGYEVNMGEASGKIGMFVGWHIARYSGLLNFPNLRWDMARMPRGPGSRKGGELTVGGYGILAKSPHPDEAWELLKFIINKENSLKQIQTIKVMPVRRSIALLTVLQGTPETRKSPKHPEVAYESLKDSVPLPDHPDFHELASFYIQPEIDLLVANKRTPEKAGQRAAKVANSYMRHFSQVRTIK